MHLNSTDLTETLKDACIQAMTPRMFHYLNTSCVLGHKNVPLQSFVPFWLYMLLYLISKETDLPNKSITLVTSLDV